eukprot:15459211-Alexandrium_andersonii.AAC.1
MAVRVGISPGGSSGKEGVRLGMGARRGSAEPLQVAGHHWRSRFYSARGGALQSLSRVARK